MTAGSSQLKQLIAMARDGSSEKRRDLLRDITDIFMAAPNRYTASELQHFDVIMSRAAGQVETTLRREIAEKLADVANAPKGLMRQLAHDEITVAEPVLGRSEALNDDDFAGVVRLGSQAHVEAIAKRRKVTRKLTSELVERGGAGAHRPARRHPPPPALQRHAPRYRAGVVIHVKAACHFTITLHYFCWAVCWRRRRRLFSEGDLLF